jgi:hypothetical protein
MIRHHPFASLLVSFVDQIHVVVIFVGVDSHKRAILSSDTMVHDRLLSDVALWPLGSNPRFNRRYFIGSSLKETLLVYEFGVGRSILSTF